MKKIFITAGLVASAAAFAQTTGKVGVNEAAPQATLDIKPNSANLTGTTNEGILIPRLTAARTAATATPVVGTLVYVTDAPAGANAASFSDTTAGFYYWNGTIWTKMGGGAAGVANNIYTADGTLTAARTVTQNNQNLTFTTGTAQMRVNGTSNLMGAQYAKSRQITGDLLATTWAVDDYNIVVTGTTNALSLPDATTMAGRMISVTNQTGGSRTWVATAANRPLNGSTFYAGRGCIFISDGTTWQMIAGY